MMYAPEEKARIIRDYIFHNEEDKLAQFAEDNHPADLAEAISDLEREERISFFSIISPKKAALVLPKMGPVLRKELLEKIEETFLSSILKEMSSHDVIDILEELPENWVQQLLDLMKREKAESIAKLLGYKENTAGRIMTLDFFSLPSKMSVAEAIEELRKTDVHHISYIYIVDDSYLIGVLSLRALVVAAPNIKLYTIANKDIVRVTVDVDQEEVANLVRKYNLRAIPVVLRTNKLVGIVTIDNILDIVTEEASEDIYYMAGVRGINEDGLLHRSIPNAVYLRLPILIVCLIGGTVAAGIIGVFEDTLAALVILAAFIPVIMDMGGNVGTQSSTIVTRGLATGSVDIKVVWSLLWRELRIGVLIGAISGFAVGIIAQIWKGIPDLGIVVGISMIVTITVAAVAGAFFPIFFERIGVDPAIASGPVITSVKDITGLLIYFTTATLLIL